ncbi:hypothetical protein VQ045_12450 [Aurantimonas sp. E1-2-R+4]|uniref:hypothetical protein n=1 Tax=Aurantimonas sp. E1-2-R+4 TaxID=3113714 RepID=UPI002F924D89
MRTKAFLLAIAVALQGCAASQSSFYANPAKQNVSSLCRAVEKSGDPQFSRDLVAELISRGVTVEECRTTIRRENTILAGVAIAGAAVAVGVAAVMVMT